MFKQPRIPEYRESDGTNKYLRSLVLFLKDFCMECWVTVREIQKNGVGGGLLRALTSDPREGGGGEPDAPGFPGEEDTPGAALYREVIDYIYPIGRTITTFDDADNPNTLYPWQVWEQTAKGRMIIGTGAPDNNDDGTSPGSYTYAAGSKGGESTHGITVEEMPRHLHDAIYANGDGGYEITYFFGTISTNAGVLMLETGKTGGYHIKTSFNGGSQPHNNMPPYIAANIWKRVS